jgi:hypothetical protein
MIENLRPGSHLVSRRSWYTHHGIYIGGGRVVHYAGYIRGLLRSPVEEISLEEFARAYGYRVKANPRRRYATDTIVTRARSRLGESRYHVLFNNCEHFCEWCISGESWSAQAEAWLNYPLTTLVGMLRNRFRRPVPLAAA